MQKDNYASTAPWYGVAVELGLKPGDLMKKQRTPWLEKHIRHIVVEDEDLKNISEQELNTFCEIQPWALLKLASVRYLGTIYRDIISKRYPTAMYYVDLFCGSGISRVVRSRILCYGSPLIMNLDEKDGRFTKMFFNDDNQNNIRVLNSWLATKKKTKCVVTCDDANSRVQEVASELGKNSHSLIFVDPYSTEFSWTSMETILKLKSDIFFLFQTALIPRGVSQSTDPEADIQNFFRDYNRVREIYEDQTIADKRTAIFNLYKEDIKAIRGSQTLMESIRIKGGRSYYYDMLFVTKKTERNNPWWNGIVKLKNEIELYNKRSVEQTLRVIERKHSQSTLTGW